MPFDFDNVYTKEYVLFGWLYLVWYGDDNV